MKTKVALLLMVALICLPGCGLFDTGIRPEAIEDTAKDITTRHDKYVTEDGTLSDLERRTYLRSSELLLEVIEEAK